MALIPSMLLRQLYTFGSLKNSGQGIQFAIKNRLSDAEVTELQRVSIDGQALPLNAITLDLGDGTLLTPDQIAPERPIALPLRKILTVHANVAALPHGKHKIEI